MSRSTTALKRLGVAGLATVTMGAVLPTLVANPASANHVSSITLTPETATAAENNCTTFTATISPVAQNVVVDVNLAPRTANVNPTFCTLNASGTTITGTSDPATAGNVDNAEFTTDASGKITFGVVSDTQGTIDVTAFVEEDGTATDDGTVGATEPSDTSVLTVTLNSTPQDVTAVDAEPETGTVPTAQPVNFTVKATNASGQPASGQEIYFDVTSGPNATAVGPTSCGLTDQTGTATCTYTTGSGTGTDTIVAYINNSTAAGASLTALDSGDTQDTITRNVQAALAAGATVDLACADNFNAGSDTCQVPLTKTTEVLTATVKNAAGAAISGALVEFTFTAGNEAATATEAADSLSPTTCTTNASGQCSTTLTNPTPAQGDAITVQAQIRTGATTAQDTTTVIYRNPDANEARVLTLTPESATTTVGNAQGLTATVVDRFGNPVAGVEVTFTESGTGRFANGASTFVATTNASGQASVDVVTTSNETPGSTTVTATITTPRNPAATNDDECEQPANTSTRDASGAVVAPATGNQTGAPAGACSDTSTVNFVSASPSPSPTSASPTPTSSTPASCAVTPTVTLEFGTINATGSSGVTVNAPANSQIQLLAYSQPSTTYRVVRQATIDNNGTPAQFRIVPPTNTRLYAQIVGCDTNEVQFSKVLNVRTTLSLNVTRTGTRAYRFFGDSLPARPGGLIVSLYRVTDSGSQVLTAQTRANAQNGDWVINRVFTGTGRFGFVVRTGQDLQNAPGASNTRSLLIF